MIYFLNTHYIFHNLLYLFLVLFQYTVFVIGIEQMAPWIHSPPAADMRTRTTARHRGTASHRPCRPVAEPVFDSYRLHGYHSSHKHETETPQQPAHNILLHERTQLVGHGVWKLSGTVTAELPTTYIVV